MLQGHGQILPEELMEKIAISKFKVTCSVVLERVRRTKKPVLITRSGEPVAEIVPVSPVPRTDEDWLGSLAGTGRIVEDIINPAADLSNWEVLR
jgi:prevent-host-death family protein